MSLNAVAMPVALEPGAVGGLGALADGGGEGALDRVAGAQVNLVRCRAVIGAQDQQWRHIPFGAESSEPPAWQRVHLSSRLGSVAATSDQPVTDREERNTEADHGQGDGDIG
jgi:hypothetical protein